MHTTLISKVQWTREPIYASDEYTQANKIRTLTSKRELCNINKLKFDVIKYTRKWMKNGRNREGPQPTKAKRKWIVLFGLNRFNKLPLYSRCNSVCVYSIRWPFSSRRELVKGGNSTAPIKLVVVVDRIHLVYIAQCTYYNLISNWLSYSVRYSWVFAFVSPPPTTTTTVHFTIITITVAHVQLPPPCKLPFAWLFHLYSTISCLQNIPFLSTLVHSYRT